MEVMEEGNLMDRVRILLQHDMAYYQERQTVLHETLCSGIVGGLLDFPHYASFAAYKIVLWWEEEYLAAFRKPSGLLQGGKEVAASDSSLDRGCGGVAKTTAPKEFVQMTAESGEQLLEHLHSLSQEALDHADLTVLAATLGAAALIRSCLWCYHQLLLKARQEGLSLHAIQKQFHSMAEALAERLLDLHCRLLSLYVLQDADCLNWEDPRPFFEGERGSFTVQMWWLYMQGTRTDLWNTAPPHTAQRVFAGMLNESLTILTVRYATVKFRKWKSLEPKCSNIHCFYSYDCSEAEPSAARSALLVTDLTNILLCARELAVSVCADAAELVGLSQRSKIIRDVHAKCHELLTTLLLRGCPLDCLHRVFRKGLAGVEIFSVLDRAPSPWIQLVSPTFFRGNPQTYQDLEDGAAISLELSVLLAQPQPSWPLLLRLLMMRNCRVASLLLSHLIIETRKDSSHSEPEESGASSRSTEGCGRFLCCGDCSVSAKVSFGEVESALVHVVATVGGGQALKVALMPALEKTNTKWGGALDRGQVWNQKRPPWLNALLSPLQPMVLSSVETVVSAVQAGAPASELVPLTLSCLVQLAPCVPPWLKTTARYLGEQLPADVHALAGSPLLQLVVTGVYAGLHTCKEAANLSAIGELEEALCRLDEDTQQGASIQEFLRAVDDYAEDIAWDWRAVEESLPTAELLVSKILLTSTGRQSLKVLYQYVHQNASWILSVIGRGGDCLVIPAHSLLHTMFRIGNRQFDQYLAGSWSPDWSALLHSPLGLSREKAWAQLQKRAEFSDFKTDPKQLSHHDAIIVGKLTDLFSQPEQPHLTSVQSGIPPKALNSKETKKESSKAKESESIQHKEKRVDIAVGSSAAGNSNKNDSQNLPETKVDKPENDEEKEKTELNDAQQAEKVNKKDADGMAQKEEADDNKLKQTPQKSSETASTKMHTKEREHGKTSSKSPKSRKS